VSYTNGSTGWGRLVHEVTDDDLPLANGAEAGDFVWKQVRHGSCNMPHSEPMKASDLSARPSQDRILHVQGRYQRHWVVQLTDLLAVSLHAMLSAHDDLMRGYERAIRGRDQAREAADAKYAAKQAPKEATKRLGGRDQTAGRRTTKAETIAQATLDAARDAVSTMRFAIACLICVDIDDESERRRPGGHYWDTAGAWSALANNPSWASLYNLTHDGGMDPLKTRSWKTYEAKWKLRQENAADRAEQERTYGLQEALTPPPPPVTTCECCGQEVAQDGPPAPGRRRKRRRRKKSTEVHA
jgi:hypothetical protein